MAEYRDLSDAFAAAGATIAAVSVDEPAQSDALRRELGLPFPLLCDPHRRLIREWNLLNPKERGGIARPAVIVIDRNRRVRLRAADRTEARVAPAAILEFLRAGMQGTGVPRRRWIVPRLRDWRTAVRNALRRRGRAAGPRRDAGG